MKDGKYAGLWRHSSGVWYFRQKVPKGLEAAIGCRLISVSLKTRDRSTAINLWRVERNRVDQLIAAASERTALNQTSQWSVVKGVTDQLKSHLIENLPATASDLNITAKVLRSLLGQRGDDPHADVVADALRSSGFLDVMQLQMAAAVDQHLKRQGVVATSAATAETAQKLAGKLPAVLEDGARTQDGDFTPSKALAGLPAEPIKPATDSRFRIGDLVELWIKASQPAAGNISHARTYAKEFVSFAGTDVVSEVTSRMAKRWKLQLQSSDMALNSAKARIRSLSALFGVAVVHEYIDANPFQRIGAWPKTEARSRRRPFTQQEATAVLKEAKQRGGWVWWLFLLGATTGARITEIAQLRTIDLQLDRPDGIPAFAITHQPDHQWPTRTKNSGSQRVLPIPEPVLRAGFIEWAKAQPAGYLFRVRGGGSAVARASAVAGDVIRSAGISDSTVVFHSLRHLFEDLMRDAKPGINYAVAQAITGRLTSGSERFYGGGASVAAFRDAMAGIDLGWVPVAKE